MGVCWWRYKACVQKLVEKAKSNVETVIEDETENVEIEHTDYVTDTVEEELNSSVEYSYRERIDNGGNSVNCEQCQIAENSSNPQHICRICRKVVCNLFCSIMDPTTDNEMKRVHKPNHPKCIQFLSSTFEWL